MQLLQFLFWYITRSFTCQQRTEGSGKLPFLIWGRASLTQPPEDPTERDYCKMSLQAQGEVFPKAPRRTWKHYPGNVILEPVISSQEQHPAFLVLKTRLWRPKASLSSQHSHFYRLIWGKSLSMPSLLLPFTLGRGCQHFHAVGNLQRKSPKGRFFSHS